MSVNVRRQLYSQGDSYATSEVLADQVESNRHLIQINQKDSVRGPEDKHGQVRSGPISPGSLKVSINRSGLKESPQKSQKDLSLKEDATKREYPKRRRIDRLSFIETGNDTNQLQPINNRTLEEKASSGTVDNLEQSLEISETTKNVPVDILLLEGFSKEVRPVIPKLVLKRVKKKQGIREFETMEIVSPTKEQLGMYYSDEEIKGVVVENDKNQTARPKLVRKTQEMISVESKTCQEVEEISLEEEVYPIAESQKKVKEGSLANDGDQLRRPEGEDIVLGHDKRILRRKRRRVSSESEGGEEFTDALQAYGGNLNNLFFGPLLYFLFILLTVQHQNFVKLEMDSWSETQFYWVLR